VRGWFGVVAVLSARALLYLTAQIARAQHTQPAIPPASQPASGTFPEEAKGSLSDKVY